jgi:hypothetical protein
MRKTSLLAAVLSLGLMPLPASAQAPAGNVAHIFRNAVKAGSQAAYEQGRKKHMAFHRQKGDAWTWFTWETLTGDNTGQYVIGSFGHAWKDFDGREKFDAEDLVDAAASMGPYQNASTQAYYVFRPDLSVVLPDGKAPAQFSQVTHFYLNPEGVNDFIEGLRKVNEGVKTTKYPSNSTWYQLFNGGEGPEWVLVAARASWADFQPPDKTLDAMMEEAFGKASGAATLASLRKAVRYTRSEILRYRPELSYLP